MNYLDRYVDPYTEPPVPVKRTLKGVLFINRPKFPVGTIKRKRPPRTVKR